MAYSVPKLKDFSAAAINKAADKLISALEKESTAVKDEAGWKAFRDRWMARKDGVVTQVNDLWLKAAPKEAKRDAGQIVNQLKTHIEKTVDTALQTIQGSRRRIKAGRRARRHHASRYSSPRRSRTPHPQDDE